MVFEYEDLRFQEKEQGILNCTFLQIYKFELDITKLGKYTLTNKSIDFDQEVSTKWNMILSTALDNEMTGLYGRPVIYVHEGRGLPLMGYHAFGIVDRGSSIVEARPLTGCNLDCVYCSVDEGKSSTKIREFVVEPDYLVQEMKKLLDFKKIPVEVHIGTQGEPSLYKHMPRLIKGLKSLKYCKMVSMETNGMLLTEKKADELLEAGLDRLNLSLDTLDPEKSKKITNSNYDNSNTIKAAKYMAGKLDLIIAPVWVPNWNTKDIPEVIKFGKEIGARVCIQNFLHYRNGRNIENERSWDDFYSQLKKWEVEFGVKLQLSAADFDIVKTPTLDKPIRKGEIIKPKFMVPGRTKDEWVAVYKDRCISVLNCKNPVGKVKIIRIKDNIFSAVPV